MEATKKLQKFVSSSDGTIFNILGQLITVKVHSWDGNGNYVYEISCPPGLGIPPHVHSNEDEVMYVLEGELEVMVGGEVYKAGSGDCINLIRNIPHAYMSTGTSNGRVLVYVSPGQGFEEFFNELRQFPPGPPDMEKLNSLCEKYGIRNL
jgi:quercetin dioxygenase-like cupin family protein